MVLEIGFGPFHTLLSFSFKAIQSRCNRDAAWLELHKPSAPWVHQQAKKGIGPSLLYLDFSEVSGAYIETSIRLFAVTKRDVALHSL